MCGIAGVYADNPAQHIDPATVRRMVAAMRHRGPDEEGFFDAPGVCLGMCRLAIIDIEGGSQPMISGDGRVALIQNGEIYNHVELRADLAARGIRAATRSDTEVLLHLVEHDSDRFPAALNGMFAIATYDRARHQLTLVRDQLGKKPLYVWRRHGVTAFASELRALLASGLVPVEVDEPALWDLLSYNYVPDPGTMLRGVEQVAPGARRTVERGAVSETAYWAAAPEEDRRSAVAIETDLVDLIEDAVRLRLRADVPVGIFLSGGLDSSTVAWAAARAGGGLVTAYSIAFPGDAVDEAGEAALTAAALDLPHRVVPGGADLLERWPAVIDHAGAPHGDVSFLALDALSSAMAPSLRVALTGDGADELLGGYSWHVDAEDSSLSLPALRQRWERNSVFSTEEKHSLAPRLAGRVSHDSFDVFRRAIEETPEADNVTRRAWADVRILLPGNNLVKVDRMGMAHALELRSPFLDHRLVEFTRAVPGHLKADARGGKLLLRRAMERRSDGSVTPRPKHLFTVPVDRWLAPGGAAAALLDRLVKHPSPLVADALDAHEVARRVREYHDGYATGRRERLRQLRLLLAIDLWSRAYQGEAA